MIHDFRSKPQQYLLVFFIIAVGLLYRTHQSGAHPFGFDQVQIITNAERILTGQPTLIGPRTGPAAIFTGPLIYYLTALIMLFSNPYSASVITPVLLAAITALSLYYLFKRYVNQKSALIALSLWALSPFLINMDRVFWNPNLSLLAFSLVFFPIFFTKKAVLCDYLLVFLGSFLAYQAHFSGLLILPILLLLTLTKLVNKKYLIATALGLGLSLLPTLVFDLRHNFLNYHGLISLITGGQTGAGPLSLLENFYHNLLITGETWIKLFFLPQHFLWAGWSGLLILSLIILKIKPTKINRSISLWLIMVALLLAFYQGEKPEYYFLISLPALLYYLVTILNHWRWQWLIIWLVALAGYSSQTIYGPNLDLSLGNSLAIYQQLMEINQQEGIKQVIYDVPHGQTAGLEYLVSQLELTPDQGSTVHLIYPADNQQEYFYQRGRVAINKE